MNNSNTTPTRKRINKAALLLETIKDAKKKQHDAEVVTTSQSTNQTSQSEEQK